MRRPEKQKAHALCLRLSGGPENCLVGRREKRDARTNVHANPKRRPTVKFLRFPVATTSRLRKKVVFATVPRNGAPGSSGHPSDTPFRRLRQAKTALLPPRFPELDSPLPAIGDASFPLAAGPRVHAALHSNTRPPYPNLSLPPQKNHATPYTLPSFTEFPSVSGLPTSWEWQTKSMPFRAPKRGTGPVYCHPELRFRHLVGAQPQAHAHARIPVEALGLGHRFRRPDGNAGRTDDRLPFLR